jgi:hypothetical protein
VILLAATASASTLSGTVTDADGAPLSGVTVIAYDPRLNYADARTTTDGGFSIGMLPPGRYRVRALPADDDPHVDRFAPDEWNYCDADVFDVGSGDSVDGVELALPVGGTLSGRIVDSAGAPVANADVLALGESDRSGLVSRLSSTDDDGAFSFVGLDSDPGSSEPYAVYVGADGWPLQYLGQAYDEDLAVLYEVTIGEDTVAEGDSPLLDGIVVQGTVTGPDGPVSGGSVYVYASSQVLTASITSTGTYEADGLPPGDVIPWATVTGLATTYYPDTDRPGDRIDGSGEGTVVTGADLTMPAETVLTVTIAGEGDLSESGLLLYNDTYTVGRGASADADGVVTIDALFDGTYYLYVYGADVGRVDDYVRGSDGEPLPIVVSGDTDLTVDLPVGASISGVVVGDDGEPVYGAYVYLAWFDGSDSQVTVTDSDGLWSITGLPAGDFTLETRYSAYCPNDASWVTTWWPDHYVAEDATKITLAEGETLSDVEIVAPRDDDQDQMGDSWEGDNGLDSSRDDAAEDPDGDGITNYDEWLLGTDPTGGSATDDGCRGCGKASLAVALLPLALLRRRAARTGAPRRRAFRW